MNAESEVRSPPMRAVWPFSCMRNSCPQSVAAVFTPNTTKYPRDSTHRKGESRKSLRVLSLLPAEKVQVIIHCLLPVQHVSNLTDKSLLNR